MVDEVRGPLPIKIDSTSNREFRPVPLTEHVARASSEAERRIGEHAKRVGLGRRAFLQSLCGAATTLLTLKDAFALAGNTGGVFSLPKESAFELAAAADALAGDEFIFDIRDSPGRSDRRVASLSRQILGAGFRRRSPRPLRRRGSGRLLFRRSVHQAHIHGQRHRRRRALVRTRIAREQPAVARGSRSRSRSHQPDGRCRATVPPQEGAGHRPAQRQACPAAPQGSGREGQDRALQFQGDRDQPAVHHRRRQRPQASRDQAVARQARSRWSTTWSSARSSPAVPRSRMPACRRARSTRSSWSAA